MPTQTSTASGKTDAKGMASHLKERLVDGSLFALFLGSGAQRDHGNGNGNGIGNGNGNGNGGATQGNLHGRGTQTGKLSDESSFPSLTLP